MKVTSRRERERQELRELILSNAKQIIDEEGYDALTIRKVAGRIEYSPMALYNHFPDKTAILLALAQQTFEGLERLLPKATQDPLVSLREAMLVYIRFGLDHPNEYRVAFMTRLPGMKQETVSQGADVVPNGTGGRRAFEHLVDSVAACKRTGLFDGPPFQIATALWAGMHGVVSLQITQTAFPFGPRDEFSNRVVDLLLRGLRTEEITYKKRRKRSKVVREVLPRPSSD